MGLLSESQPKYSNASGLLRKNINYSIDDSSVVDNVLNMVRLLNFVGSNQALGGFGNCLPTQQPRCFDKWFLIFLFILTMVVQRCTKR